MLTSEYLKVGLKSLHQLMKCFRVSTVEMKQTGLMIEEI
jgi:hypothetical protein